MHIFKNLKQKDYLRVENFLFLERNTWKVGQKNIRLESRDTISNIVIEVGEEQQLLRWKAYLSLPHKATSVRQIRYPTLGPPCGQVFETFRCEKKKKKKISNTIDHDVWSIDRSIVPRTDSCNVIVSVR